MKIKVLQVDAELYDYIAQHTQQIGESASDILRRLLKLPAVAAPAAPLVTARVQPPDEQPQQIAAQLLKSSSYRRETTAIGRFMRLLATLYQSDPQTFSRAAAHSQGRTRRYFALDPEILLRHSRLSKPQNIPGTPYWVITNTNAARKCAIIRQVLAAMKFPTPLIDTICDSL